MANCYVIKHWSTAQATEHSDPAIGSISPSLAATEAWLHERGYEYHDGSYRNTTTGWQAAIYPIARDINERMQQCVGAYVRVHVATPRLEAEGTLYYSVASNLYRMGGAEADAGGSMVAAFTLMFDLTDVAAVNNDRGDWHIHLLQIGRRRWFCNPGIVQ